jgi:hypothetical protein
MTANTDRRPIYSQRMKAEANAAYSPDGRTPRCSTCPETDPVCLTLSHYGPFTAAERREARRINRPRLSGSTLRSWLRKQGYPKDPKIAKVRTECMNCNLKHGGWGRGGWEEDGARRRGTG